MAPTQLTCRIRVEKPNDQDSGTSQMEDSEVLALKEYADVENETRMQWAGEVRKHFERSKDSVRSWDFLAKLDGSVVCLATTPASAGEVYPARFQIPLDSIRDLDEAQKIRRTKMFAMASLLYEIMSGKQPFEGLTQEEVLQRFSNGEFPDDAVSLPNSLYMYSGWSEEFSHELTGQVEAPKSTILNSMVNHAKAHPYVTGIQIAGLTLSAVSFLAVPILGAVGFTAAGPAAGSAAAAWQASIGAVEAGSLFAWCQSAAMGGAAIGGIQAAGVAGTALTKVKDVPGLVQTFKSVFRNSQHQGTERRAVGS